MRINRNIDFAKGNSVRVLCRPNTIALLGMLTCSVAAAANKTIDQQAIESMAGCYEVTFEFHEMFAADPAYVPHAPYKNHGLEWVTVDNYGPSDTALQHILITPGGPMKHWRQEWVYRPTSVFDFVGDNHWVKRAIAPTAAAGMWAQRVLQVDDGPRYECAAPWVHWGANHYWECATWAPLPRRESGRTDYNVLARRNRHALTNAGWVQEEDNNKLALRGSDVTSVTQEKGQNIYRRVDAARCQDAADFWQSNKVYWHDIQTVWHDVYAHSNTLHLTAEIGGTTLWERLFELAEDASATEPYNSALLQKKAREIILTYVSDS